VRRLPGGAAEPASLLHFGCHATVIGSLSSSYLQLAGNEHLTIAQIVAQAQARDATADGFLAVLGACMSDLTDVDHEEALTLASALLAAGASGVVGARWPTDDRPTALLMVMFHHCLNSGPTRPAEALRAAQT
jgi:CHAT domain-containing protein